MGAADVLAILGAIFFILLIFTPFIPGGPGLMLIFLGLLPLALLVVLIVKMWELSGEVRTIKEELEALRNGREDTRDGGELRHP
ncbi:hypothetical protein [Thermococcus sp. 21S7]|uniref:hypothetical protein n=1 Tax=Thermococcus sp. 21S7 TaxID=1638221 RepID=UPI00143BA4CE|nr:hypothetical protein [Thermococcus sp. 21S7]NJE60213.1 hypothetical protein [Thermococcus sp. 21S7]